MLRLRDDDVLVRSSSWGSPFDRFKEIHDWVAATEGAVVHVPTVLVLDIQEFPDCIAYMRKHTEMGTMEPEIHGYSHIDYARLWLPQARLPDKGRVDHSKFSQLELESHVKQVTAHLEHCIKWIEKQLGRRPTKWYTPWGADNVYLRQGARNAGVELVGTENLFPIKEACTLLRQGSTVAEVEARGEMFIHWWERGTRVRRVCASGRYGSWAEARKQDRAAFEE